RRLAIDVAVARAAERDEHVFPCRLFAGDRRVRADGVIGSQRGAIAVAALPDFDPARPGRPRVAGPLIEPELVELGPPHFDELARFLKLPVDPHAMAAQDFGDLGLLLVGTGFGPAGGG